MTAFNKPYIHSVGLRRNLILGVAALASVWVYGCSGVVSSSSANSPSGAIPPSIMAQVANQIVSIGQTATFSVTATGTAPLSYQWQKNASNITGATAASYTTLATTQSDSGSTFRVVVSNMAGTVTSAAAMLTVNGAAGPPTIAAQPAGQTVTAGQTATFSVMATGTAPLNYQWQKNASNIAGAIAASYTTPATMQSDSGSTFRVAVSNMAGTVTSAAATLTVTASAPAKTISVSPSSLNFGNVDMGSSSSQNITITNTGNSTVTITQIVAAGSGFTSSGSAMSLPASQKATVAAQFAPVGNGPVNGTLSIQSDANGSPAVVSLSGMGVIPGPTNPNAWFVRPDGGTAAQCTGKGDAAYPGSGSNQACAFINPHYLWGNDVAGETAKWKIAGGDTVIIRNGSYRIGYKGPNSADAWGQCPGDPSGCGMPPIPSGTVSQHTRILGENYASCTSMPELHGGYGLYKVLSLEGVSNVDVQCMEITDHASCGTYGNGNLCKSTYPLDDYAEEGIVLSSTTSNINLTDVNIHGMAKEGMNGSSGGGIALTRVRVAGNVADGWNMDDGKGTHITGTITMSYVTVEWNGCGEVYPPTNPPTYDNCFDDNSGGYGDGIGTPDTGGTFLVDHSTFRYNTQDGLDLLHVDLTPAFISVTNSTAYGNMGNQMKAGTAVTFQNNVVIGNCLRMKSSFAPNPSTYNAHLSDFCRALGDAVVISPDDTHPAIVQNNSVSGNYHIAFTFLCGTTCSSATHINFDNNLIFGFPDLSGGHAYLIAIYENNSGSDWMLNNGGSRSNNLLFNISDACGAAANGTNEVCSDPLLSSETDVNAMNFHLTSGSPARNAGEVIPAITIDYDGKPRPAAAPYDIGAFQF
jgi:hypothetical protein